MKHTLIPALALAVLCAPLQPVFAAADMHDHQHAQTSPLRLDNGKKWATDAPLRSGMHNVRNRLEHHMHSTHGKGVEDTDYNALATDLQREVTTIFEQCRLAPNADAALHVILSDVLHGISVLKGEQKNVARSAGVTHIAHAVNNYATYFDHPNWKPLSHH